MDVLKEVELIQLHFGFLEKQFLKKRSWCVSADIVDQLFFLQSNTRLQKLSFMKKGGFASMYQHEIMERSSAI